LQSINGLGIKKAHALIRKFKTIDRVLSYLRSNKKYHIPQGYDEGFAKAELTFLHQRVFDHTKNAIAPLTPFPDHFDQQCDFLGPEISTPVAIEIAIGNVNPISREFFCEFACLSKQSATTNNANFLPPPTNLTTFVAATKQFLPPRVKDSAEQGHQPTSPPKKRKRDLQINNSVIIAPRTPSPPRARSPIVRSKYFAKHDSSPKQCVEQRIENIVNDNAQLSSERGCSNIPSSFISPFVGKYRVSVFLNSPSVFKVDTFSEIDSEVILSDDDTEQMLHY